MPFGYPRKYSSDWLKSGLVHVNHQPTPIYLYNEIRGSSTRDLDTTLRSSPLRDHIIFQLYYCDDDEMNDPAQRPCRCCRWTFVHLIVRFMQFTISSATSQPKVRPISPFIPELRLFIPRELMTRDDDKFPMLYNYHLHPSLLLLFPRTYKYELNRPIHHDWRFYQTLYSAVFCFEMEQQPNDKTPPVNKYSFRWRFKLLVQVTNSQRQKRQILATGRSRSVCWSLRALYSKSPTSIATNSAAFPMDVRYKYLLDFFSTPLTHSVSQSVGRSSSSHNTATTIARPLLE